jgi:peptidoglycan/xylan/chitin deacetylase (PgdA/CDA1 family)
MISFVKKFFQRRRSGAIVLMYHRICETGSDPWDLCVAPGIFDQHLAMLKERYHVIPAHRLADRLAHNDRLRNLVAITFDDGYLDNFENAKPILEKHNLTAAFFFTTKFRTRNKKFWWDELEHLILHTAVLPDSVNITVKGKTITMLLGESCRLSPKITEENRQWRYGMPYPNSRIKLYFELWSELKPMNIDDQEKSLQQIRQWANVSIVPTPPLMNETHIRQMAAAGLFEIGAHSVNHPALGTLSAKEQLSEIKTCKEELENIVSLNITGFAYPYGHYNEATPLAVKQSGFQYALTTEEIPVTRGQSRLEMPRFQVKNIPAEELFANIEHWRKK